MSSRAVSGGLGRTLRAPHLGADARLDPPRPPRSSVATPGPGAADAGDDDLHLPLALRSATGDGGAGAALTFAVSLLAILGSHELGHWALARWHGVDASLPYFIPAPFLGFGTLGALIRIRGPIPHRNALVDIGAAGPLAGLAVAIPLLAHGLSQAPLVPIVPVTPWELAGPGYALGPAGASPRGPATRAA